MARRGGDQHRLTRDDVPDNGPEWSFNADGTDAHPIAEAAVTGFGPAWSPDGAQIAYTRYTGASSDLFVIDVYGTGERRITHSDRVDERLPAWSPDGGWIASRATTDRRAATWPWCASMARDAGS